MNDLLIKAIPKIAYYNCGGECENYYGSPQRLESHELLFHITSFYCRLCLDEILDNTRESWGEHTWITLEEVLKARDKQNQDALIKMLVKTRPSNF